MRVLVVDDEPKVVSFLKRALQREGYAVDVAPTGEEALLKATTIDYDVILLDVVIPEPDGLEVCRRLRARKRWTPILLLSGMRETESRVAGLDAGADDYLTKPFALSELSARIRALERRKPEQRPAVLRVGDLCLDPATRDVTIGDEPVKLTPREFAMLHLFMRNQGRVLTRGYILEHVWDYNFEAGSNVVDVYIRYLRKKIDRNRDPDASHIQSVRGVGYRLRTPGGATERSST